MLKNYKNCVFARLIVGAPAIFHGENEVGNLVWLRTSRVESIEIMENCIKFRTRSSKYVCTLRAGLIEFSKASRMGDTFVGSPVHFAAEYMGRFQEFLFGTISSVHAYGNRVSVTTELGQTFLI